MVSASINAPLLQGQLDSEKKIKGSILEGTITKASADPGLMQRDSWWTRGSETSRVVLRGTDKDSRFYLSIMEPTCNPIKLAHRAIHYAKLNISGETVYVNINSISKRLLLPTEVINQAMRENKLEVMIQQQVRFLSFHRQFFSLFEFESGKYAETEKFHLKETRERFDTQLVMLVQGVFKKETTTCIWQGDAKTWAIYQFDKSQLIGEGGFFSVYRAKTFRPGMAPTTNDIVVKVARSHFPKKVNAPTSYGSHYDVVYQATNEQTTLEYLQKQGLKEWVPKPNLVTRTIKNHLGVMTRLYTVAHYIPGDTLAHFLNPKSPPLSLSEKIKLNIQLLQVFGEYCMMGNVYHGDLKPDNFILGKDGFITLIDWGGSSILSRDQDPVKAEDFCLLKAYTKRYLPNRKQYDRLSDEGYKVINYRKTTLCCIKSAEARGLSTEARDYTSQAAKRYQIALECRTDSQNLLKQFDFQALTLIMSELTAGVTCRKYEECNIQAFLGDCVEMNNNVHALLFEMSTLYITPDNIDALIQKWEALLPKKK